MSHRFIEVITDFPTTEEQYVLLVHLDQIAQIRPEIEAENEPRHEPVAVIILTNGEMLILKNSFKSVVKRLTEAKMVMRP
ncbi:hypothetical protein LWH48_16290 [Halomonas sp. G15]|uniref:Uncharacterized protein n=2 Tax=Halomonas TaxID=2745 RepID=A0A7X4W5U2_9GAMM|nr:MULTISPECIES: hypothetical protein [Halomonas]MCE0734325.1 hypothetical protein [Halomonas sp. G15]NAW33671.1 hypothetical protein [Halomonas alimentaria]TDO10545.1 hypothetical protein DFO68_10570 [Halomonas ventosae]